MPPQRSFSGTAPKQILNSIGIIVIFTCLLFGSTLSCNKVVDKEDVPQLSSRSTPVDTPEKPPLGQQPRQNQNPDIQDLENSGYFIIDAELLDDGTLLTLYAGLFRSDHTALVLFDNNLKPKWQILNRFRFPHTIDYRNKEILISDSDNRRLVILQFGTDLAYTIDLTKLDTNTWPNDADFTADGNILYSDLANGKACKINRTGRLIWSRVLVKNEFSRRSSDDFKDELHDVDELPNGNLLFCLSLSNQVLEIDSDDNIVWRYAANLWYPKTVQRLENGNTLIGDKNRVLEVSPQGKMVWEHAHPHNSGMNYQRTKDGNTLIGGPFVGLIAPNHTVLWHLPIPAPTEENSGGSQHLDKLREVGYL